MAGELILVIDDQLETREFITDRVLAAHGYRSLVAADGQSGLQKAIEVHPDLIIFGAAMSGLSGLWALDALKERGHPIPVVAIVSQDLPLPEISSLHKTVADLVYEPLNGEDFLAAIDRALNGRGVQDVW